MRYVDKKRTASDLVHRKNRDSKKSPDGKPASDPLADFLAAAIINPSMATAEVPAEPEVEVERKSELPVEPTEPTVALPETYDVEESPAVVETMVATESDNDGLTYESADDTDDHDHDADADQLLQGALDVEEQRYQAELDLVEQQKLEAERLGGQREAIDELQSRISNGTKQLESLREQARDVQQQSATEFEENANILKSLQAHHDALVQEFQRQQQIVQESSVRSQEADDIEQQIATLRDQVAGQEQQLRQLQAVETVDPADIEIRNAELANLQSRHSELAHQLATESEAAETRSRANAERLEANARQIAQLRQEIASSTESLEALRQPVDTQQVDDLEAEIDSLTKQRESIVNDIHRHTSLLAASTDEIKQQANALAKNRDLLRTKIQTGQNKLAKIQADSPILDIQANHEELGALNAEYFRLKTAIVETRADVEARQKAAAQELARHQQRVKDVAFQIESAKRELAELETVEPPATDETHRSEFQKLTNEHEELRKAVSAARAQAEAREQAAANKVAADRARLVSLQSRVEFEKQALTNLQKAKPNEALQAELDKLSDEAARQQTLMRQHAELKEALKVEHQELSQKRDQLQAQVAEGQEALESLAATVELGSSQTETLRSEIRTLTEQQAEAAAKRRQAESDAAQRKYAAETELQQLTQHRDSLTVQLAADRDQLTTLANAIHVESTEADALRLELKTLTNQLNDIRLTKQRTQAEAEHRRHATGAERQELIRQRDQLQARLTSDAAQLETQLAALSEQHARVVSESRAIESQVAEMRLAVAKQTEDYHQQIETLQQEIETGQQTIQQFASSSDPQQFEDLRAEIALLQKDAQELRQELRSRANQHAAAERAAQQREHEFLRQRDSLRNANQAAREKLNLTQPDAIDPADLEIRKAEIQSLTDERDSLEAQVAAQQARAETAQRAAEEQLSGLNQQIAKLQQDIGSRRETLHRLQEEVPDRRPELEETFRLLTAEAAAVQSQIQTANAELAARAAASKDQQATLTQQTSTLTKQIQADTAQLEQLRSQLAQTSGSRPDNSEEIQQLVQQRRDVARQLADAKVKLAESVAEKKKRAAEYQQRSAEAERLQAEVTADWKEVKAIANQLRDLEKATPAEEFDLATVQAQRKKSREELAQARARVQERTQAAADSSQQTQDEVEQLRLAIEAEESETSRLVASLLNDDFHAPAATVQEEQPEVELAALLDDDDDFDLPSLSGQSPDFVPDELVDDLPDELVDDLLDDLPDDTTGMSFDMSSVMETEPAMKPFALTSDPSIVSPVARTRFRSKSRQPATGYDVDIPDADADEEELAQQSEDPPSRSRRRSQSSSVKKMRIVLAGTILLTLAVGGVAISAVAALALPHDGTTWLSFIQKATWIIPALTFPGLLCCAAIPRRAEARGECWWGLVSALVIVGCVALSPAGITGWTWMLIGAAATLYMFLLQSYLAELSKFAQFRRDEKLAESLISATSIGAIILAVAGVSWLVSAPEVWVSAVSAMCLLALCVLAAATAFLLGRLTRNLVTELTVGQWGR
jgi:chromosome segregation ATPase